MKAEDLKCDYEYYRYKVTERGGFFRQVLHPRFDKRNDIKDDDLIVYYEVHGAFLHIVKVFCRSATQSYIIYISSLEKDAQRAAYALLVSKHKTKDVMAYAMDYDGRWPDIKKVHDEYRRKK